jgi:hypothetical protein
MLCLHDIMLVMDLLKKEIKDQGHEVMSTPTINCKLFEYNSGAFEQPKTAKYRLQTCHINAAWHHFRSYVATGLIQIQSIQTDWQLGDTFTKQVSK